MKREINALLESKEALIRYAARRWLLNESRDVAMEREELSSSLLIRGQLECPDLHTTNVYYKWCGPHWVLTTLADFDYSIGDERLLPLRERVYEYWLSEYFYGSEIPLIDGRYRRCASQQGNALYVTERLGIADERNDRLVELLIKWQWPDGGWNCDKNPTADTSSFHETIAPLRGLIWYQKRKPTTQVKSAIKKAAEVFLSRELYVGLHNRRIIHTNFTKLIYPWYWHYNILYGLTVLKEGGFLSDPRCQKALQLLESRRLSEGSFPNQGKHYHLERKLYPNGGLATGYSPVNWSGKEVCSLIAENILSK